MPPPSSPLGLAVATGLLLGVTAVMGLAALPPMVCLPFIAALGLGLWRRHRIWRPLGAALFGFALASAHGHWALAQAVAPRLLAGEVQLSGEVLDLPLHDARRQRFDLRVEHCEASPELIGRRLQLSWYRTRPQVGAGEHWQFILRLRAARGLVNPGGFDFERRAIELGLAATAQVRTGRRLAVGAGIDAWRERMAGRIDGVLAAGRGRYVRALAIGDTRGLDDRDWEVLRINGLTHLIAISGFHVGMLAGAGAWLVGRLHGHFAPLARRWPRQHCAALAAVATAGAYTAMAGLALPTVRTWAMIAAVALACLRRRRLRLVQALALALIGILVVDPFAVLAPGFWLSFAGVVWLMGCLPDASDGSGLRGFLRAQAVVWLGLTPISVWFFGQASLAAPLVNLLGIPWISLGVVPLCLLGLVLAPLSPQAAAWAWQAAAQLMDWLCILLDAVAASPGVLQWLPEPSLPALLLACAGVAWWLAPRALPARHLAPLLCLPLLWPQGSAPPPAQVELVLFDVGQGLAVLVRTHAHALLYDAGPAQPGGWDAGASVVVPALHGLGVRRLDRLLISHGDNDHAGGVEAVRAAFPQTSVQAPEGWKASALGLCQRDQHWRWDGVEFRILHPPPFLPYLRNESSCVLRVDAGGQVALLAGDIGRQVESRLVKEQANLLRAEVLIAPHHGSAGSSSVAFLQAVRPRLALFAVGADNRFGLPREEVLERYAAQGSRLLDSAGSGAIRVRLGAGALAPERWRSAHPRWWRAPRPTVAGARSTAARSGYAIGGFETE